MKVGGVMVVGVGAAVVVGDPVGTGGTEVVGAGEVVTTGATLVDGLESGVDVGPGAATVADVGAVTAGAEVVLVVVLVVEVDVLSATLVAPSTPVEPSPA